MSSDEGRGKCESVGTVWARMGSGDETCEKARGYGERRGAARELLEGLWRVVGKYL
jgi:hypothetical protein